MEVAAEGLQLHPDKTHVGDCRVKGQGFEFLGYRFEAGQRRVRKKSLNALKDKIRSHTKRTQGQSLQQIIAKLNPMLRGWFNYFKHAHRSQQERDTQQMRHQLNCVRESAE